MPVSTHGSDEQIPEIMNHDAPEAYLQDRPLLSRGQRWLIGLIAPLLVALPAAWWTHTGSLRRLENILIDKRFEWRGPRAPDPRIVLVRITEKCRRRLTQGDEHFELRPHLTTAIARLSEAGTAVIGLDLWLQGESDPETDARLADAITGAYVVLGVAVADEYAMRAPAILREAMPDEGSIVVRTDEDGTLRRLPDYGGIDVFDEPSGNVLRIPHFPYVLVYHLLAYEAEMAATDPPALDVPATGRARIGDHVVRYGSWVNYAAGPDDGFAACDLADVVLGACDLSIAQGAIVILGSTRSAEDQFALPISDGPVAGMYYHANVVDMILQRRPLATRPTSPAWRTLLVGGFTLGVGLYAFWLQPWWRRRRPWLSLLIYLAAGAVVAVLGWGLLCAAMFHRDVLVPMAEPLIGAGVAFGAALGVQLIVSVGNARRFSERNRQIEAVFSRNVSPQVLRAIKRDPRQIGRMEERDVTVLFCDIRGFTSLAAKVNAIDVADMLNEYFETVTQAVFEQDGFVDKFVGDEMMAVFGAPLVQMDHINRAVRCACRIKALLAELNNRRAQQGKPPMDCGIGIHTGIAAAGHIGSSRRSNYTVVGDTVNTASRIEQHTTGGEILVSEQVAARLDDQSRCRPWKRVQLRGLDGDHQLFKIDTYP